MCDYKKNGREPYTKGEIIELINALSESVPIRISCLVLGIATGATIFVGSIILLVKLL